MENKKSIGFYCCTNGLGHYKRVYEVAKLLTFDFNITIYCSEIQAQKIGTLNDVNYVFYSTDNIRWDLVTSGESKKCIKEYTIWTQIYGNTTKLYDIVILDNIISLLKYRKDCIIMGSFLWKDVFKSYLGTNSITEEEQYLLDTIHPLILTNKYVETQSVKTYSNKFQTGFGCADKMMIISDLKYLFFQLPSLNYNLGYQNLKDSIYKATGLGSVDNISYIDNTAIVARPGVGTITHCVENYIPLVALYSSKDSQEIIELARIVEDLKIGFSQNIDEPIRVEKFKSLTSNVNYCYSGKFEKNGYIDIANYIKKL